MSPIQTTVLRALLGLVVVVAAPQDVFAQEFQALSASVPTPTAVTTPLAMRAMALPDAERLYNIRESRLADHHRQGPLQELAPAALEAAPAPQANATAVIPLTQRAVAPIVLVTNRALTDAETDNGTSEVGEPSLAVRGAEIIQTGNWYASFSIDGGTTFSYVNPDTTFPAIPNQPFCCDQVAIYDPAHDLMVWYLQYVRDDNSNTGRLAVAQGNDIATQQWRFYDFTPQAIGHSGEWFDYPEMAVGDQFLYLTTNMFTTVSPSFTRAVVLRLPLDKLSTYQGFNYNYFESSADFSLHPTLGATDTMYLANHVSTNRIRVFTWPESGTTITADEVNVDIWSNAQRVAPGPDGRDWLGRADQRMTAGWMSGDEIGFAWTAAQDGNFSFPHVRVAVLNKNTKAIVAQPHIWNPDFAFAYPDAAPNQEGVVGISLFYGGGAQLHPSHAVGVLQPGNAGWDLVATANGTHGPAANRWGDYVAARPHGADSTSWVAAGYTQQGGPLRTDVEPRYVHFRLGPEVSALAEGRFEYAAKIVCGAQKDPANTRLARGFYATAVNVRNPNRDTSEFDKKLALTFPPDEQKPGEVMQIAVGDRLEPDQALEVDCIDVQRSLFPDGFPDPGYIKGYIIIESKHALDVTAVYSSATLGQDGGAGDHSSIDVERIYQRRVEQ